MNFNQALKVCKKIGTNHATGDSLRAMYASLLEFHHGGNAERYYRWFTANATGSDPEISKIADELLSDRVKAWDALIK